MTGFPAASSKAKKTARAGPVIIEDRGKPSHVLMTYSEFECLTGKRRNEADALIASTALVHNLVVVTRSVRDFDGTGVVVVDPWHG
ncbi:type II toxin-antitoxin system Phd/YefM family antitoxin [Agrobacterium tumefaciens]|uniref:Type II toxin-antitoxin system Phd/YefM family antitoxin n=2 Tax=Agrobacterium tumefaciens TaxID=358 RepID=A0A4D7Z4Y6_AGRTU|nr:type II toxin-antitoxin system Phd/YefM family antitoxin [Agrobacterium tumefaciens]QCL97623.1 type II toxin-antitoxin system Phd/YefM family antitoxin [Agrobacterium tumefaciens]